jgi:hypothetical protein
MIRWHAACDDDCMIIILCCLSGLVIFTAWDTSAS